MIKPQHKKIKKSETMGSSLSKKRRQQPQKPYITFQLTHKAGKGISGTNFFPCLTTPNTLPSSNVSEKARAVLQRQ